MIDEIGGRGGVIREVGLELRLTMVFMGEEGRCVMSRASRTGPPGFRKGLPYQDGELKRERVYTEWRWGRRGLVTGGARIQSAGRRSMIYRPAKGMLSLRRRPLLSWLPRDCRTRTERLNELL